MAQKDWQIHLPSENCTFYFTSYKAYQRFIDEHITTGKDGLPVLIRGKQRYINYYDEDYGIEQL